MALPDTVLTFKILEEFENLNHEMSIHNMALPDTFLAFKILEGAMINDNQQ